MEDGSHPIWPQRAVPIAIELRAGPKCPEQMFDKPNQGRSDSHCRRVGALAWAENNHLVVFNLERRQWRLTRAGQMWLDRLERAAS